MTYLIDTENLGKAWASLLPACGRDDRVVLYYTKNTMAYAMPIIERLVSARCAVDFVPCATGHNSLDFHLVADLTLRAANAPGEAFVIVSRDTGFDSAVAYLRSLGFRTGRLEPPKELPDGDAGAASVTPALSAPSVIVPVTVSMDAGNGKKAPAFGILCGDLKHVAGDNPYFVRLRSEHPGEKGATLAVIANILSAAETRPSKERKQFVNFQLSACRSHEFSLRWYPLVKPMIKP